MSKFTSKKAIWRSEDVQKLSSSSIYKINDSILEDKSEWIYIKESNIKGWRKQANQEDEKDKMGRALINDETK